MVKIAQIFVAKACQVLAAELDVCVRPYGYTACIGVQMWLPRRRAAKRAMDQIGTLPLRFEPFISTAMGRPAFGGLAKAPLPSDGPIGEAWLLSDRDEHPSRVAEGPLKGRTIAQLIERAPKLVLGKLARRFRRFPLLLKFLDVQKMLSVQVHPSDCNADLIPKGETGKTEAWVVLEAEPASRVYAGLKPGTTAEDLRALSEHTANKYLTSFTPRRGQGILIEAGVVHSLGDGVVVFEVQENSDVTFRPL